MALGLRDLDKAISDLFVSYGRRLDNLERMPSGRNSIGIDRLAPAVKSGAPVDSDFLTPPPVGAHVYDVTNSKWWVRHSAAGVWKGVVVA